MNPIPVAVAVAVAVQQVQVQVVDSADDYNYADRLTAMMSSLVTHIV